MRLRVTYWACLLTLQAGLVQAQDGHSARHMLEQGKLDEAGQAYTELIR